MSKSTSDFVKAMLDFGHGDVFFLYMPKMARIFVNYKGKY